MSAMVAELPPDDRAPGQARERTRAWLERVAAPDVDDVVLLVSELVSNAVAHASSGPILLSLTGPQPIRCEVTNLGDGSPQLLEVPTSSLSGRGIALVSRLASRWGTSAGSGRTTAWFELDC